jgi:hypothetical protein
MCLEIYILRNKKSKTSLSVTIFFALFLDLHQHQQQQPPTTPFLLFPSFVNSPCFIPTGDMSSRRWNTTLERLCLEQLVELTTFLIVKDTKDTSDDGDSSSLSCSADDAFCVTVLYNHYINDVQEESVRIEFGRRPLVRDFDDVTCLSKFCFRKPDLQQLANLLWPRLAVDLPGVREAVVVKK